jgi:hypothetical protein
MHSPGLGFDPESDQVQVSAAIKDRSNNTVHGHKFEGDRGDLAEYLEAKLFHDLRLCSPIRVRVPSNKKGSMYILFLYATDPEEPAVLGRVDMVAKCGQWTVLINKKEDGVRDAGEYLVWTSSLFVQEPADQNQR